MSSNSGLLQKIQNKKVYHKYAYDGPSTYTWVHPAPGLPIRVLATIQGMGGRGGHGGDGYYGIDGVKGGGGGAGGVAGELIFVELVVLGNIEIDIQSIFHYYVNTTIKDMYNGGIAYGVAKGSDGANGVTRQNEIQWYGCHGQRGQKTIFGEGGRGGKGGIASGGASPGSNGEQGFMSCEISSNNGYGYGAGGGGGGGGAGSSAGCGLGNWGGFGTGGLVILETWELF